MVYYCGREHQQEDWQRHRPDCRILSERGAAVPPAGNAETQFAIRLAVTVGADKLMEAVRDDILPDHEVGKIFGLPSEQPMLEQAVFACYQSAVCVFGVTREQIVDAHMNNSMDELILSNPAIRGDAYGRLVVANGGIKLERFPGVP